MWKALVLISIAWGPAAETAGAWQPDTVRTDLQDNLERVLDTFDAGERPSDGEQLGQWLQELAAQPVNINRAGLDELMQVPGIRLRTAGAVIAYRDSVKPFESVEELEKVSGIGRVTLKRVRPYVTVGRGTELVRTLYFDPRYWIAGSRFELISRYRESLQKKEGYRRTDSSQYQGSPVHYYQRFRYRSRHLSANLTQEKDAGEPLRYRNGFDFNSWHLALENNGRLRRVVAGDYTLSFGQGLLFWNGGLFGRGREATAGVAKNERGIRPYTSSREYGYFRGGAATYGNKLRVTAFYSGRRVDATPVARDTMRLSAEDGLHRTSREREKRGIIGRRTWGGRVRAEFPFGYIGASGYTSSYDRYIKAGNADWNRYDFSGRTASVAGLDYRLLVGRTELYGEVARSRNGGYGMITGLEGGIEDHTELVVAYRNYGKGFQSPYGSGFGELSGAPRNEEGWFLGIRHEPVPGVIAGAYFDQYRFPAPRYGTHGPTQGQEWLGVVEADLSPGVRLYLQGRSEREEEEYEITGPYGRLRRRQGYAVRSSVRLHFEYRVNRKIWFRTRGEWVRSRPAGGSAEQGYLVYQGLRYRPSPDWTFDTRLTLFETGGYGSRLYQYEHDLYRVFSNTVLFDRGQRLYLLVHVRPARFLDIWAKWGHTVWEDRLYLGSGLDRIRGNIRSEIGVQVRIKV